MLDAGSSTGGFTDFALQNGAKKVIAVDVGTNQLHPSLRNNSKIELYEKTDIRNVLLNKPEVRMEHDAREEKRMLSKVPDIILIDISFISLREALPHIFTHLCKKDTQIVTMVKPQFEAGGYQVNKGIIKNDTVRRQILKEFETWVKQYAVIIVKADSDVTGSKGNRERFYLLNSRKDINVGPVSPSFN